MTTFVTLMRRADTLRKSENDAMREAWWTGYIRGLRRAHHGENFGTAAEHDLWLSAIESSDARRAALGRGYRAGLTLEPHEPDADAGADLAFSEYGYNNPDYAPSGVFIGRDRGNNPLAVKIVRAGGVATRRFDDSRLADHYIRSALEIQRTHAPLADF